MCNAYQSVQYVYVHPCIASFIQSSLVPCISRLPYVPTIHPSIPCMMYPPHSNHFTSPARVSSRRRRHASPHGFFSSPSPLANRPSLVASRIPHLALLRSVLPSRIPLLCSPSTPSSDHRRQ